jgi:hypothetical protein
LRTRSLICFAGAGAIVGLALIPSARAVYIHARNVIAAWQTGLLISPAFWIWMWASWMAVTLPASMLGKVLPMFSVEDAGVAELGKTVAAFTIIAMGVAVVWQFLAWGSMPLLQAGGIRYAPFVPWPGGGFTAYAFP